MSSLYRLHGRPLLSAVPLTIALSGAATLLTEVGPAEVQIGGQCWDPDKPTGLSASAIWMRTVNVGWNEDSGADSYQLQLYLDLFGTSKDLPTDGIEVSYYGAGALVHGLPDRSPSWYRLRAVNPQGASEWSELFVPMTRGQTHG